MLNWLHKMLQTRYVATLEEEVARERAENERLRAENRALLNSLLGTAGFPPVEFPEAPKPQPVPRLRRRSWHQMQAWRENDAAHDAAGVVDAEDETGFRATGAVPHS